MNRQQNSCGVLQWLKSKRRNLGCWVGVARYPLKSPASLMKSLSRFLRWISLAGVKVGLASARRFRAPIDRILAQFGKKRTQSQKHYGIVVREGAASPPWEDLKLRIYLGREVHREARNLVTIPRVQLRAATWMPAS
jgi:hypothetical protein